MVSLDTNPIGHGSTRLHGSCQPYVCFTRSQWRCWASWLCMCQNGGHPRRRLYGSWLLVSWVLGGGSSAQTWHSRFFPLRKSCVWFWYVPGPVKNGGKLPAKQPGCSPCWVQVLKQSASMSKSPFLRVRPDAENSTHFPTSGDVRLYSGYSKIGESTLVNNQPKPRVYVPEPGPSPRAEPIYGNWTGSAIQSFFNLCLVPCAHSDWNSEGPTPHSPSLDVKLGRAA